MRPALLAAVLLPLALAGCLREDLQPENHLRIAGIDVAAPRVSSGFATLVVNVTLDNSLGGSGPVRVVVKAFDTSTGLLVRTGEASPGALPKDRTVAAEVPLEVPRRSGYRLEVAAYEDGKIVQTASVTASNVGALPPNLFETGLRLGPLEFLVRDANGTRVAIEAAVYVTNEGAAASQPLRVQVKAREVSTGLLSDEAWGDVPSIAVEATRVVALPLDVPNRYNYEVEAVLWDGDHLAGQARGKVQLLPTFTRNVSEELVVTQPDISDFVRQRDAALAGDLARKEAAAKTPAPGALLALGLAGAVALLARRRRPP